MELWTREGSHHHTTTMATLEMWLQAAATSLPPFVPTDGPEVNVSNIAIFNKTCHNDLQYMDFSEYEYNYRKETWITITWREVIKIMAYVIVFLVSLVGNLLVILVVYYNNHMRTTTNQYLVNLALADLLVTVICMWVHIVRHLSYPHYVLPALVCKLDGFVQATSLLASVLTLTVISVGRFVAVMFPLHARTSPDRARRVIAAVWISSALLSCPTLFYRQLFSVKWKNFTTYQCEEFWPTDGHFDPLLSKCVITYDPKKHFYIFLTIAVYFLPVGIMFINYSLVVWRLWMTKLPGEQSLPARNTATRAKRKVVKMVSVVLLVFVLCWTPLQTIILYISFVHEQSSLPEWFSVLEFSAYFVAYSNSALNPIIYCGFNANFRQGLMSLLTCRHSASSRMYHQRNWRGMTGGTRETTVGCSGPEPAVVLEFSSFKRNRTCQKGSMSCQSGRAITTGSTRDLPHNHLTDIIPDKTCKNWNGEGKLEVKNHLTQVCSSISAPAIYTNECVLHTSDPAGLSVVQGKKGGKLSTRTSNSSSSSRSSKVCGCCVLHSSKKANSTVTHDNEIYELNDLHENISNNTKEEIL
nr:substance-K receptor-like [Procambarus clarkii]